MTGFFAGDDLIDRHDLALHRVDLGLHAVQFALNLDGRSREENQSPGLIRRLLTGQGALVVYTAPAGSREYTPADSGDIDPASLKLTGSVLSWLNAGVAKSATLR